jgi:ribosomal-protein-alanine N-acetyltransferase
MTHILSDGSRKIGYGIRQRSGIEFLGPAAVIRYHRCMLPDGETERLVLRPLAFEDAERIQQIFPHWEVVRYLNRIVPWPYPANGAQQYLKEVALPGMERGEEFHWTLRLKSAPQLVIGTITLRTSKEVHRGFWLGSSWHGQGLMMEAAAWANDFWFETLGQPVLRVDKAVDNRASRRISEKQGMRLVAVQDKEYVAGRLPSETWEITAEEWRACKRRS